MQGETIGAVVILSDITDLRKLENIRKDFVANVSHEIKTPITSNPYSTAPKKQLRRSAFSQGHS